MDTLSRIVEIASGQPYDAFLKQRLFDPLGMKDTGFCRPRRQGGACGRHSTTARLTGLRRRTRRPGSRRRTFFSGGGGLWSTAEDYAQFAQMLVNGGELNGRRLLSPRTVAIDGVQPRRRHLHRRRSGHAGAGHGIRALDGGRPRRDQGEPTHLDRQLRLGRGLRDALLGGSERNSSLAC